MGSSLSTKIKVGFTTVLSFVILFAGTLWVKQYNPAAKKTQFSVVFENGNGISAGDPVSISGIKVGEVNGVSLSEDNKASIEVTITKRVNLYEDCSFTIDDVGLMGDKTLEIVPGTSGKPFDASVVQYGTGKPGLSAIMASSGEILEKLNSIADKIYSELDIRKLITSFEQTNDKFQQALTLYEDLARDNKEPIKTSIDNFEEASQELKTFIKNNDSKLAEAIDSFRGTTDKVSAALDNLDPLKTVVDTLSYYINTDEGSLARLLKSDELYEELRNTNASIDSFVTDFKRNPGKYTNDIQFKIRLF